MNWGAAFEAIRPWLLLAFNGGLLAIGAKLYVDNRRLRLQEKTRAQEYRLEVSADGRTNLQFIIDNLRADIVAQREATEAQAAAHKHCQDELRRVLDSNRKQGAKLDGLSKQFVAFAESAGRAIPPGDWSPAITSMMQQLDLLAQAARGDKGQD